MICIYLRATVSFRPLDATKTVKTETSAVIKYKRVKIKVLIDLLIVVATYVK